MELAEKLRRLRNAEGMRRGLWRPMTQHEVTQAMRQEIGVSLSQAYLSQLEGGKRVHLTNTTREALARFYHVHPGYLVSDPPGYASGGDQDGAIDRLLTRLTLAPEPARALRLLDWLLRLPPDELAALEQRLMQEDAEEGAQENAQEDAEEGAEVSASPITQRAAQRQGV